MQVPEKLALIGGSILLSSTLVFTLKSQASSIIPNVGHSISGVFDHIGDAQRSSDFDSDYQQAQQKGWQTGNWGSAKYYIDDQHNMHVGSGQLQNSLNSILGDSVAYSINTVNIDQHVQAPQDSSNLFSGSNGTYGNVNTSINNINGLNNVDTSHVTNMYGIFSNDSGLRSLDLLSWNTSNVTSLRKAFDYNHSLKDVNINNWDVSNVTDMGEMFGDNFELDNINLSNWHNSKTTNTEYMFNQDSSLKKIDLSNLDMTNVTQKSNMFGKNNSLDKITLNNGTSINNTNLPASTWLNGNQALSNNQLVAGHAGTWIRQ